MTPSLEAKQLETHVAAAQPDDGDHPRCVACGYDVRGLPPTFISVNEADPLRDEGIEFYRLLLRAGVSAQCRVVMGTSHGMDVFAALVPDLAAQTAASIAQFART